MSGTRHTSRLATNTSYAALATLAGQASLALLMLFLARRCSVGEFGHLTALYGLSLIASDIIDFGTTSRCIRDSAAGRLADTQFARLGTIRLSLCGIGALAIILVGVGVLGLTTSQSIALGLASTLKVASGCVYSLHSRSERFGVLAVATASERLGALAFGVALSLAGAPVFESFNLGLVFGLIVGGVVALFRIPSAEWGDLPRVQLPPFREFAGYWRFGRMFAATGLVTDLLLADAFVVSVVASSMQAGLFSIGARLTGPFALLSNSLAQALQPRVAASNGSAAVRRSVVRLTVTCATVTAVPMCAIAVFTPRILAATFGQSYIQATDVVRLYCISAVVLALNAPLAAYLQAAGRSRMVAGVMALGVMIHLVAVTLGASVSGAVGAAFAYLIANSVILLFLFLGLRLRRGERSTGIQT